MKGLHLTESSLRASTWASTCQPWGANKLCPTENNNFKMQSLSKNISSGVYNWGLLQAAGSGKWVYSAHFLAAYGYFLTLPSVATGWKMFRIFPPNHREEAEHSWAPEITLYWQRFKCVTLIISLKLKPLSHNKSTSHAVWNTNSKSDYVW